jgi:hypothetical protein
MRTLRQLLHSFMISPPQDRSSDDLAMFRIAENELLLRPSLPHLPTYPCSDSVERIEGKRAVMRQIEGHPDLHQFLWFQAGSTLPPECRWVFRGNAALIYPKTMIVFAVANGTHRITVRVPTTSNTGGLPVNLDWTDRDSSSIWVESPLELDVCRSLLADAMRSAGAGA